MSVWSRTPLDRWRRAKSFFFLSLLGIAAAFAILPLLSVFVWLFAQGWRGVNANLILALPAPVGESGGGLGNAFLGTLTLVALASALAVPLGVATGVFLSEYETRLGKWVRFSVEVLGSIPSILVGLFVYAICVLPMKRFSLLAGGLALGILMVPIVARSTEEILKLIPGHLREAGLALGLPRWKVTVRIILRGAGGSILTGVMLAVARASGETAPLLFTAFNSRFWQEGWDQPISSLPVQIYTYAISPYEEWHQQAWAGALLLVLGVLLVNLLTRLFFGITKKGFSK